MRRHEAVGVADPALSTLAALQKREKQAPVVVGLEHDRLADSPAVDVEQAVAEH